MWIFDKKVGPAKSSNGIVPSSASKLVAKQIKNVCYVYVDDIRQNYLGNMLIEDFNFPFLNSINESTKKFDWNN